MIIETHRLNDVLLLFVLPRGERLLLLNISLFSPRGMVLLLSIPFALPRRNHFGSAAFVLPRGSGDLVLPLFSRGNGDPS